MMKKREIHRRAAKRYIGNSPGMELVRLENATVEKIVHVILHADTLSRDFTARFAPMLRASTDRGTLRNIWAFIRDNIEYRIDGDLVEIVKSPGKTFQDGYGDCKSMAVMSGSLLQNLGYKYFYRVAFYDPEQPQAGHIYAIVQLNDGTEVVLDAVNSRFDHEYRYWKKKDYRPVKPASRINGRSLSVGPREISEIKHNSTQSNTVPAILVAGIGLLLLLNY